MQLVQVEEAFKTLKGDLALRPIHHQVPPRIEAHIFVAFLAYALHVTLRRRLRDLAPGLTSRAVLEKFSPQNRLITPEEVAVVALMLIGEEARGITGQAINVSGGFVMH